MLQTLGHLDGWVVYALLALLVFGESAALLAVLLPGEIALLFAGALAARGSASLALVLVVAAVAAVGGHAAGYELGRRYGLQLLRWRYLRRYAAATDGVVRLVSRHGGAAVFVGRWTNVGRIVVPLLAGAGRMRYGTFTLYNVVGGVAWAVTFVLLGTGADASLEAVERTVGHASWWLTGAVAVGLAGGWAWRRVRSRHSDVVLRATSEAVR